MFACVCTRACVTLTGVESYCPGPGTISLGSSNADGLLLMDRNGAKPPKIIEKLCFVIIAVIDVTPCCHLFQTFFKKGCCLCLSPNICRNFLTGYLGDVPGDVVRTGSDSRRGAACGQDRRSWSSVIHFFSFSNFSRLLLGRKEVQRGSGWSLERIGPAIMEQELSFKVFLRLVAWLPHDYTISAVGQRRRM